MNKLLLPLLLITGSAIAADNQTFTCTNAGSTRTIEVAAAGNGCEVRYTKGGDTQTLWRAEHESNYCAPKAEAFVEKQKGWGYQCETAAAATTASTSAQ